MEPPRNLCKHECNVFYSEDILRGFENTPTNNFFFQIIVRDRTGLYYFSPETNQWVLHCNVNEEQNICHRFSVKFEDITGQDRVAAAERITAMLGVINIPVAEHPHMFVRIYSEALWLSREFQNIADKRIPIQVEIVRVYAQMVYNPNVLHLDEDEDEDEDEEETMAHVLRSSMDEYEYQPTPATRLSIAGLEKAKLGENKNCAICLEEMKVSSEATIMPCKHMFHECCIVEWLGRKHVCPLCRFEMPTK